MSARCFSNSVQLLSPFCMESWANIGDERDSSATAKNTSLMTTLLPRNDEVRWEIAYLVNVHFFQKIAMPCGHSSVFMVRTIFSCERSTTATAPSAVVSTYRKPNRQCCKNGLQERGVPRIRNSFQLAGVAGFA